MWCTDEHRRVIVLAGSRLRVLQRRVVHVVGQRRGRLHGRPAVAVFYVDGRVRRVGYVIVSGRPLAVPDGARGRESAGVLFAALRQAGATVVTWRRGGHTCVLAGRRASSSELIAPVVARPSRYARD